ncbi:MAG: HAD-IG family 5'-nucleotidase, partial [Acidimicrobiia bacterium]|nr:HAD-IG family 5'-nucleotidase [Acidimicrobiia bacterium]
PESTEMVMSRLLDGARRDYPSWRNYFDVMITDAAKPTFFVGRRPFEDVAAATGAPGVSGTPGRPDAAEALRRDVLYRGGNLAAFERLIGAHGPQVLYVGDHIYGDVLRANVESGWRTVMIIQEMEEELVALDAHRSHFDEIDALDREARALADDLRDLRDEVAAAGARARRLDRLNDRLVERLRRLQSERDRLEVEVDAAFHRCWGSIFSAGSELSRFGSQVERYAWLYTSRASNLGGYSPGHFFRSPRSRLAHEL